MVCTRKQTFAVLLLMLFSCWILPGQPVDVNEMSFRHIRAEEGLHHSVVYCVEQDREGLVWFALHDGLDRFNGYDFDHYSLGSSPGLSVPGSSRVTDLSIDGQDIWAGAENVLYLYDYRENTFLPAVSGLREQFQVNQVRMVKKRDGDKLFIATNAGIIINDQESDSSFILKGVEANTFSFWFSGDTAIWAATVDGLLFYDWRSGRLAEPTQDAEINKRLREIFVISHEYLNEYHLLLGTRNSGLMLLDPVEGSLQQISFPELGDYDYPLRAIERYNDRYFLLGFDGGGLVIIDHSLEYVANYTHDVDATHTLTNNGIYDLMVDADNRIWISTYGGGVNLYDPNLKAFQVIRHVQNDPNSLRNNMVRSIVEDDQHRYWFGTRRGISIYDPVSENFSHIYPAYPSSGTRTENPVLSMMKDRNGRIWAGTFSNGITIFDSDGERLRTLRSDPSDPNSLSTDHIYALYEDHQGYIWAGGIRGGLTRYQPAEDKFRIFGGLGGVHAITGDSRGRILVGSLTGFYYSNPGRDSFSSFSAANTDSVTYTNRVFCIQEDRLQRIWIGTEGEGLGLVDIDEGTQVNYTVEHGLPSNIVYGIIEDQEGYLWLSTTQGISRFDPGSIEFRNYTYADGLSGNEFNYGAYFEASDGTIFFGGTNGLTSFMPPEIVTNIKVPHILFTGFHLYDSDAEDYPGNVTSRTINTADEIRLKHNQNSFTIEFTAINYTSTEKNQYRWRMEGMDQFEDNWTDNQNHRTVAFTGLSPGRYTFRVQASNNDGIWNYQGRALPIIVSPPFWSTPLAKILYALVILAVLIAVWRYTSLIIKEKQSLEKIRFFINLAHDLRTPLTLIKGPVDDMIRSFPEGTEERSKLELVANNTERLNALISQLLDFQKADLNKLMLKVSEERIDQIMANSIKSFEPLARKSNISILYEGDEVVTGWCDRFKLERILYNLLSNAIKYSFPGGKIRLILNKTGDHIMLQVSDQGHGIPRDQQRNIFKRFYRTENIVNARIPGSGVGLMVTRRLVDKHKGAIGFSSRVNSGTTFRVSIPVNKEAYSVEELCPDTPVRPATRDLPADIPPANGKDRKTLVMVVEDNEELLEYLSGNLKNYYRVATASNGKEALGMVSKTNPDLIISDIMMPEMDGVEFCTRIRENINTSHIPLILLTALNTMQDKLNGLEYGADDYIEKPFDFCLLKARIDNLVRSRKMLQDKYVNKPDQEVLTEIRNGFDKEMMEKISVAVHENYHDSSFMVEDLCSVVGVSRPVLYRKLKAYTDLSPQAYIKTFRLKKAEEILTSTSKSIKEIAYEVGFSDPRYFSSCFKKYFGASPKQFVEA